MMAHLSACGRPNFGIPLFPPRPPAIHRSLRPSSAAASRGDSYLEMWKKAVDRDRKSRELRHRESEAESLEQKTETFNRILEFPRAERDRIQRLQLIDRAAAAIAAARALIKGSPQPPVSAGSGSDTFDSRLDQGGVDPVRQGLSSGNPSGHQSGISPYGTPGPNFWSWSPPPDKSRELGDGLSNLQPMKKNINDANPSSSLVTKEYSADLLKIPFESTLFESNHTPPLPPLQSIVDVKKGADTNNSTSILSTTDNETESNLDTVFSRHAEEAAEALGKSDGVTSHGVKPDGSEWWKETGIEQRPDGVVCKWTLIRGVSADQTVEWEDKFWEASDQFDYKELGSEKSGRDAFGNVWHEYWKETMWQDLRSGLMHIEKTADKWGKTDRHEEWQEKWWEHYNASGQAEKWAHKWCSIDPNTQLDAGHAHVWHERWGENYDGMGGSMKYTDKWAERSEGGDGWSRWGDKWDEGFNPDGRGVKQGETWWEGRSGERWNRTWGEQHNGSGWVHKYGKSSSGEHWDTHEPQDTWYERHPHYGFDLCLQNSLQLRAVRKQLPPLETN